VERCVAMIPLWARLRVLAAEGGAAAGARWRSRSPDGGVLAWLQAWRLEARGSRFQHQPSGLMLPEAHGFQSALSMDGKYFNGKHRAGYSKERRRGGGGGGGGTRRFLCSPAPLDVAEMLSSQYAALVDPRNPVKKLSHSLH